jgi:hypothetical protein
MTQRGSGITGPGPVPSGDLKEKLRLRMGEARAAHVSGNEGNASRTVEDPYPGAKTPEAEKKRNAPAAVAAAVLSSGAQCRA